MDTDEQIRRMLDTLKIIILALIAGMVAFAVIAWSVGRSAELDPALTNILLIVLPAMAVAELVAYLVLRSVVSKTWRRHFEQEPPANDPTPALIRPFHTLTIIGCAMAEGMGLFGAVIVLITGNELALIAPAAATLLLLWQLPTRDKLARFVSTLTGRPWT